MIIFDLNQIAVASVMIQAAPKHGVVPGTDILRHMILDSIRQNLVQFKQYANLVVIASDSRESWRKDIFKYYKAHRPEDKKKLAPNVDWNTVYELINEITEAFDKHFPYVVVRVNKAEGDDIIGTIVKHHWENDQFDGILIISGDKDFKQLHFDARVRQYSPVLKQYVASEGAEIERKKLIFCGDRGDGVPNVLSADNAIYDHIRQNKMTATRLAELYAYNSPDDIRDKKIQRNYYRNMLMTDLTKVPKNIQAEIVSQFTEKQTNRPLPMKVFNYLVSKQLVELSGKAGDFVT